MIKSSTNKLLWKSIIYVILILFVCFACFSLVHIHKYVTSKDSKKKNIYEFPKHIAIIMDGNGRWANNRGLNVSLGHKKGAETLMKIMEYANKIGVESLTVYAFSTENMKRPADEVDYIMNLFYSYMADKSDILMENDVKFRVIGNINSMDTKISNRIKELEEKTKANKSLKFNVAFNYGGRAEIVNAARNIAIDVKENKLSLDDLDEKSFRKYLYNSEMSDPDLVIRTGGESRLSNFLLWQISYSELYFIDVLWPDFDKKLLDEAICNFRNRKRNYGEREKYR